jgi:hypothetical protein
MLPRPEPEILLLLRHGESMRTSVEISTFALTGTQSIA